MSHATQIAERLQEVLLDGTWIAHTNYKDQITHTNWQQAVSKAGTLNTIAALTYHINYYLKGILNVFQGGNLEIRDQYSFDLPPIHNAADWDQLVQDFLINAEAFVGHVAQMSDTQLDAPFVRPEYGSYRRNIEGVIEHSYYHLGQVSIIRKMIAEGV